MHQVLVYGDSLSWGIIPGTRHRFGSRQRWPGVMEAHLSETGMEVRVTEDCLNGRRTVWEAPFKLGCNGVTGIGQRIEVNSPLSLIILLLGTNDFQSMHRLNAWHTGQRIAKLIAAIKNAPIEPGMPNPEILVVAPPVIRKARGAIAPKFEGAELNAVGLSAAIEAAAAESRCPFFDAATVVTTSQVDGVHLDAEQHLTLGRALAEEVERISAGE